MNNMAIRGEPGIRSTLSPIDVFLVGGAIYRFVASSLGTARIASEIGAESEEITWEIIRRKSKGADGGESYHAIEKVRNVKNSKIHRVTRDGELIHQHQNHFGKHGSQRQFPDEWTGTKTINLP